MNLGHRLETNRSPPFVEGRRLRFSVGKRQAKDAAFRQQSPEIPPPLHRREDGGQIVLGALLGQAFLLLGAFDLLVVCRIADVRLLCHAMPYYAPARSRVSMLSVLVSASLSCFAAPSITGIRSASCACCCAACSRSTSACTSSSVRTICEETPIMSPYSSTTANALTFFSTIGKAAAMFPTKETKRSVPAAPTRFCAFAMIDSYSTRRS